VATSINRLNVLKLPKLGEGAHADGANLYYVVTKAKRETSKGLQNYVGRSWVFRYTRTLTVQGVDGIARTKRKAFKIGLGSASTVGLAQARSMASTHNIALAQGLDPQIMVRDKRSALRNIASTAITFKAAAEQFLKTKSVEWSNPKHAAQWRSTLLLHVYPALGNSDVKAIQTTDVRRVLDKIWATTPVTAQRVRQRIETILDWATTLGFREGANPAKWKGHLANVMVAPTKLNKVEHQPSMPHAQIAGFWAKLSESNAISANCLRFIIATACRSNEARSATWAEIDLENALWIIPAARMKARVEHRIPLSKQALSILESTPRVLGNDLLFSGQNIKTTLSDVAISKQVHKFAGKGAATIHGMRTTFRVWAAENGVNDRAAEFCLAHGLHNKVEASYNRTTLIDQRAIIMQSWSDFLTNNIAAANVIDISTKRLA
jgi:integrase